MSKFAKITVLGAGVLGSQIAFQTAYSGFQVVAYDINDEALIKAKKRFDELAVTYDREVDGASDGKTSAAHLRLTYSKDLAAAVADADLVIEAVPENIDIKKDIYARLGDAAPAKTIFATNTSTLLPSSMMEFTGRPEKFLALHFSNHIWRQNTAEVMGTSETDPEVYRQVAEFAAEIGMVAIEIKKEQPGYLLNSLLVPLLAAAGGLYADGIAEPEMIDKTWKIGTGSPKGPFEIYDTIGLNTIYNIASAGDDDRQQKFAQLLKENYIDQGKLGAETGEGFYKYPR
ncbi:3-hydroxyacyl-CoA dehydrogenase [Nocardia xishanensis]|uniref:3-hydroxyacyl-CoA dehydrogenase n=1 Tax=Nocardia xishanensis TaxID=238964 RepID=A0ABW7XCK6_9NOCA